MLAGKATVAPLLILTVGYTMGNHRSLQDADFLKAMFLKMSA